MAFLRPCFHAKGGIFSGRVALDFRVHIGYPVDGAPAKEVPSGGVSASQRPSKRRSSPEIVHDIRSLPKQIVLIP